jgi:protein involved in polysaccharide export with SLBB domain
MSLLVRRVFCCCALVLALGLASCTTKAHAKAEAQAAFAAGQQQAMIRMQQTQTPSVTVHGAVKNPLIPWTQDLTVAKAIVAAGYFGRKDPTEIIVVRKGVAVRIDPKQLLTGTDPALEAGDIMELR